MGRADIAGSQVYDEKQVLQAQLDLLKKTKLVDVVAEKYEALHKSKELPAELKDLRQNAVLQLKELKADCKQLLTAIEDPSLAKAKAVQGEGKEESKKAQEKAFKEALLLLVEKNNIEDAHIESLGKYAKLHYECGNYGMVEGSEKMGAGEFLPVYRILCKERTGNADGALSALWGKLATGILLEKWDETFEDLKELREFVDNKNFRDPLQQLQQRSWILHWALFVYFKPAAGSSQFKEKLNDEVIDLFFAPAYLQAIQTNCPWMLRYMATVCTYLHAGHACACTHDLACRNEHSRSAHGKRRPNYLDDESEEGLITLYFMLMRKDEAFV